jgi:hypothetical protein
MTFAVIAALESSALIWISLMVLVLFRLKRSDR